MRTEICDRLGIQVPIFAFTHCRDVVVQVSKAGGLGVLGAVGFTPAQLREELDWIDAHIGGLPYAVDIVIPQKYEGLGNTDPAELEKMLAAMVPEEHHAFAEKLLRDHGVPEWPDPEQRMGLLGWTEATATPLLEVALEHPGVKLIANALGTPPKDVIDRIHASGRLVAALCGRVKQAVAHKQAGVDIIIAQGSEGGGHTGDVGSIVLWPQIIDAVAPTPVLAAGGIARGSQIAAALALGAQGVWCGTVWLGTRESELNPFEKGVLFAARADDAVRRKARTGKTVRMLKSQLSEAWEQPGAPPYLPTPLQGILYNEAHARVVRAQRKDLYSAPAGQVVGMINEETSVRELMYRMQTEYLEAVERLQRLNASHD